MDNELPITMFANPLLAACSASTREGLLAVGEVREFAADTVVIADGAPAGLVLFPLRGDLLMSKATARGRRQVFCDSGLQGCGGICLLALHERALAEIRGATEGAVLLVQKQQFLPLTHQDPVLCQAAWRSASSCMAHLSEMVTQLSFNTVAERVASALVADTAADGDWVRLTQTELAARVGSTREVVARCLAAYQADGLIRSGRGRIKVLDRAQLSTRS